MPKEFVERFAQWSGASFAFLRWGQGALFKTGIAHRITAGSKPEAYIEDIRSSSPHEIRFIRSRGQNGEATVAIKLSNVRWQLLPRMYHISDRIGGTGALQLLSFALMIERLKSTCGGARLTGVHLEPAKFSELFSGQLYPGSIRVHSNDYWWEDLADLNHVARTEDQYRSLYGQSFLDAQYVLRVEGLEPATY